MGVRFSAGISFVLIILSRLRSSSTSYVGSAILLFFSFTVRFKIRSLSLLVLDLMVLAITYAIDNVKTNAIFVEMSAKN